MKLLIWLLSLKKQKPRDPRWYMENQETWTPREAAESDEAARVRYMTNARNKRLEEEGT